MSIHEKYLRHLLRELLKTAAGTRVLMAALDKLSIFEAYQLHKMADASRRGGGE